VTTNTRLSRKRSRPVSGARPDEGYLIGAETSSRTTAVATGSSPGPIIDLRRTGMKAMIESRACWAGGISRRPPPDDPRSSEIVAAGRHSSAACGPELDGDDLSRPKNNFVFNAQRFSGASLAARPGTHCRVALDAPHGPDERLCQRSR